MAPIVGKISDSNVINKEDFIHKVRQKFRVEGKLVSLDVNSLFTMVPVDEVLCFLREKLDSINISLPFDKNIFLDLIKLCVSHTYFSYENNF